MTQSAPTVVFVPGIAEKDPQKQNLSLQQLGAGRTNAGITVTLTAGAATTVVTELAGCAVTSAPLFTPMTANAAAELGNGTMYISSVANGTFTITHANNGQTDRTFRFVVLG